MIKSVNDTVSEWNKHKSFCEGKICGWVKDINNNKTNIEKARKAFREWSPLRVYTNVTRLKKQTPTFSLRFLGQEVAEIRVYKNFQDSMYCFLLLDFSVDSRFPISNPSPVADFS